jgi:hypothetical protein
VHTDPCQQHGVDHVVIGSGDLVRPVDERWADDYELLPTAGDETSDP